jgi:hypothetical protein
VCVSVCGVYVCVSVCLSVCVCVCVCRWNSDAPRWSPVVGSCGQDMNNNKVVL